MKIAVWHNLPSGGSKRLLYGHVKGLIERGHEVECWCPSTADRYYLPLSNLTTEHVVDLHWPPRPRGRIGSVILAHHTAASRIQAMIDTCQRGAEEINNGGFDLLFANTCRLYNAPFISRYVDIPTVLYLGEPRRHLYEANPFLQWIANPEHQQRAFFSRILRFVAAVWSLQARRVEAREEWLNARACNLILVNSYYSRESVLRVYGLSAKVCYPGIDTSLFHDLRKPREPFIVGLGELSSHKGIEFALQSLALLRVSKPPLVWVGNANSKVYVQQMLKLAESLEVDFQPKVMITEDGLVDLLNRAALLVCCSHLEPFGLAPLEANACATPVVAVKEGGMRETVINNVNGILANPEPEAVATAVEQLLNDHELARRLGNQGRDYVTRKWSIDQSIDRLEGYLREVLKRREQCEYQRSN